MRNKLLLVDRLIMYYFIFQILFLRWLVGWSYFNYLSVPIILVIIFKKKKYFRIKFLDIIVFILFGLVIFINVLANGIHELFISNFYTEGIANLIPIFYISVLIVENYKGFKNFIINDFFWILNIYFIINIPIILKQLNHTYFLMRFVSNNPMYEDHITGLIGGSGTHQLTFYWVLLVLINIYRGLKKKNSIVFIVTGFYIIFMFIVSSRNDNTAFFIIFPIIMIQYFLIFILKDKLSILKFIKYCMLIIIVIVSAKYLYENNSYINEFVNTRVLDKIEQFDSLVNKKNYSQNDDEERIYLYKVALELGDGYRFGKGIGSIKSYGESSLPKHFGMSEISFRTYEGGLIYLISLIIIFSYSLNDIFIRRKRNNLISFSIISINLTFFSIYTMVFREVFFMFSLAIIVFIFSELFNNDIK